MHEELPELSMPTEEQVHLAAESFRMLADPTRIKLLWALLQGESSVTCLAELVGASPTTVSQHLAKLRPGRAAPWSAGAAGAPSSTTPPPMNTCGRCSPKRCSTPSTPTGTYRTTPST